MLLFVFKPKSLLPALFVCLFASGALSQDVEYPPAGKVAADLKKLLARPAVAFGASFQITKTDSVVIERGYFYSEKDEKVPVVIYKPVADSAARRPAVIFLHGTGGSNNSKEVAGILYQLTRRGIIGVAIDARFHGARVAGGAHGPEAYVAAITRAWHNTDTAKQTHPFYFDTVYDLWRLVDYLTTRPDIDANRLGMGGISMGGIETWLAASVDSRIKAAVVDIATQSLKWSLDNNRWQGRARTIMAAHQQAAKDMGDSVLNQRNVAALWNKLIPGITGEFDCPSMLRLFAPRPLLLLSTENDPNNPLPGAKIAYASAQKAFEAANAPEKLQWDIAPKLGHQTTPLHAKMTVDWFSKWL